jgi:hypothetical protein
MGDSALTGAEGELQALAEWIAAIGALRSQLLDEPSTDAAEMERKRLLVLRLRQAENRLRAIVGLPPLML